MTEVETIRGPLEVILAHLIENRADLPDGGAIEIDIDAARDQANLLLDRHGLAIAELSVGAVFDLIRTTNVEPYDAAAYQALLEGLEEEDLVARIQATGRDVVAAAAVIERRKDLAAEMIGAANIVVRGVLWSALVAAVPAFAPFAGGVGTGAAGSGGVTS